MRTSFNDMITDDLFNGLALEDKLELIERYGRLQALAQEGMIFNPSVADSYLDKAYGPDEDKGPLNYCLYLIYSAFTQVAH